MPAAAQPLDDEAPVEAGQQPACPRSVGPAQERQVQGIERRPAVHALVGGHREDRGLPLGTGARRIAVDRIGQGPQEPALLGPQQLGGGRQAVAPDLHARALRRIRLQPAPGGGEPDLELGLLVRGQRRPLLGRHPLRDVHARDLDQQREVRERRAIGRRERLAVGVGVEQRVAKDRLVTRTAARP